MQEDQKIFISVFQHFNAAFENAGMSSGFLLVTRFLSTTTSASTYSAPAFLISWIIDFQPVSLPSLQHLGGDEELRSMADPKDRLPALNKLLCKSDRLFIDTEFVGRVTPGNEEGVKVADTDIMNRPVDPDRHAMFSFHRHPYPHTWVSSCPAFRNASAGSSYSTSWNMSVIRTAILLIG